MPISCNQFCTDQLIFLVLSGYVKQLTFLTCMFCFPISDHMTVPQRSTNVFLCTCICTCMLNLLKEKKAKFPGLNWENKMHISFPLYHS